MRSKNFDPLLASSSDLSQMTLTRAYTPFSGQCARKIKVDSLSSKDAIIILIGSAGSGKDNFLRVATGLELVEGTNLSAIRVSWPELCESDICFLDTPAFNHQMSDKQIEKTINEWSDEIYRKELKLEGLLHFHRISDTHTARAFMNHPKCFQRLISDQFDRLVLTTTMWDEVDGETGDRQEEQIRANWRALINHGSSVKRFHHDRPSTFEILEPIIRGVNTRNGERLEAEKSVLGNQLKIDPSGHSLFPEIEQALSQLLGLVQSIRDWLMKPSSRQGDIHQLTTEYLKVHTRMRRVLADMQRYGFSMGERLQMATRQLNWEPFIRETVATNGIGLLKEEGPSSGPSSRRDYDSWKGFEQWKEFEQWREFKQWKEFEKWKEFKQWKEYEQWMRFRQRRVHQQMVEEPVDTNRAAEAHSEQGNAEQRKSVKRSPSAVSLSKKYKSEGKDPAAGAISSQPTVAPPKGGGLPISSKSTPANAALTVDSGGANPTEGPPATTKALQKATLGGTEESATAPGPMHSRTKARQQTTPTMGGETTTETATETKVSGKPAVHTSDFTHGRKASTNDRGSVAKVLPGSIASTAIADKPNDMAAVVLRGDHGKPSDGVSNSSGSTFTSSNRQDALASSASSTGVTTGRGSTGPIAAGSGQTTGNVTGLVVSASPPGTSEGSRPTTANGGQPIATQGAAYPARGSLPTGSSSISHPSRGQTGGSQRSGALASGTVMEQSTRAVTKAGGNLMGTIPERTTPGSQISGAAQTEAYKSVQDARSKNGEVRTDQAGQWKSVNKTSDSSSTSSSNRNQNEGHQATAATGVSGKQSSAGTTSASVASGKGIPIARTSQRPNDNGESTSPPAMASSTSFSSSASRDGRPTTTEGQRSQGDSPTAVGMVRTASNTERPAPNSTGTAFSQQDPNTRRQGSAQQEEQEKDEGTGRGRAGSIRQQQSTGWSFGGWAPGRG